MVVFENQRSVRYIRAIKITKILVTILQIENNSCLEKALPYFFDGPVQIHVPFCNFLFLLERQEESILEGECYQETYKNVFRKSHFPALDFENLLTLYGLLENMKLYIQWYSFSGGRDANK